MGPSPPVFGLPFVSIRNGQGYLTVGAIQFLTQAIVSPSGGGAGGGAVGNELGLDSARFGPPISPSAIGATPTIAGSTTAGAQTYATQWGMDIDIGPIRLSLFNVALSALDAATAGNATVGHFTMPSNGATLQAGWLSEWGGITLSAGHTQLGLHIAPTLNAAALIQSGSANPPLALPVSALSATATLVGGLAYLR